MVVDYLILGASLSVIFVVYLNIISRLINRTDETQRTIRQFENARKAIRDGSNSRN